MTPIFLSMVCLACDQPQETGKGKERNGAKPCVALYFMDHHVPRYIQMEIEGVKLALPQLSTQGTI